MGDRSVRIRFINAAINPSDINQIQGVYANKPPLPAIAGNEGVAVVEEVGSNVTEFVPGNMVLPAKHSFGLLSTTSK